MSVDAGRAAALLRQLADVFAPANDVPAPAAETPAPKRGRGRPVTGEAPPAATVAATTSAPTVQTAAATDDPFATPAPVTAPVPTATSDEVRAALKALAAATSQENALALLKSAGGAPNLTELKADKYGAVVAAAQQALKQPASVVEPDDPFAVPIEVVAEVVPTIEQMKALILDTQKRTSADTVVKIVMKHGGKSPDPKSPTGEGPNLKALPVTAYLTVQKELKALPTTKE